MTRATTRLRTWRFPRLILTDHLVLLLMVWAVAIVIVMLSVIVISRFREITVSGWDVASGAAPWYVAFIGGYLLHTVLPIHIAHGRTRRDFAIEALIFGAVFVTVAAVLITLGFVLEHGLYALNDWSREKPAGHLFSSYTAYGTILAEYWLTLSVWTVVGAFVGAAIYRAPDAGWLSIIPAIGLVALAGVTTEHAIQPMGFITNLLPTIDSTSLALTAVVSFISFLIALALTWPVIRDMPLRNASR